MRFELTYDYLCPFARNASEAVLNGLAEGRDWEVTFRPFSLSQVHVDEGEPDVLDDLTCPGILAFHWSLAVRDHSPEHFPAVHRALFAARHDRGLDLSDDSVIRGALEGTGVDLGTMADVVASGAPLAVLEAAHRQAVDQWRVFGVPTFIVGDGATFVRLMERGQGSDIDRVLELLGWDGLNEFKRTRVPR